ncbi:hypothetical protein Pint_19532 [Pistacia integerrima]|uniref:Uncharacterized protein n=1 Tax=Pistacia integerrima TaxID=434235 RepID=A0ACC0X8I0_9ROSI|nr:hypothetical protein Pint_19532 [Pistacia integerrima]
MDSHFKFLNLQKNEWDRVISIYECWEVSNDVASKFYQVVRRCYWYVNQWVEHISDSFSEQWIDRTWILYIYIYIKSANSNMSSSN